MGKSLEICIDNTKQILVFSGWNLSGFPNGLHCSGYAHLNDLYWFVVELNKSHFCVNKSPMEGKGQSGRPESLFFCHANQSCS